MKTMTCPNCGGSGKDKKGNECVVCRGTGEVKTGSK